MRRVYLCFHPWLSLERLLAVISALASSHDGVHDCAPSRTVILTPEASRFRSPADGWYSAVVPELRAAEELLDLLENCGFTEREFSALGDSAFEVRWR